MELIPFGEVARDRYDISKKYNLIEQIGGIWRLTDKCKKAYDSSSYVYYLQGKVEKPKRLDLKQKPVKPASVKPTQVKKMTVQEELKSPEYQKLLDEIFNL